jgi:hypothetical protein
MKLEKTNKTIIGLYMKKYHKSMKKEKGEKNEFINNLARIIYFRKYFALMRKSTFLFRV